MQHQQAKKSEKVEAYVELNGNAEKSFTDSALMQKLQYDLGVEWKDLDLRKLLVIGTSAYTLECALLYPFDLVKTRLQVDKGQTSFVRGAIEQSKQIYHSQGIRGFYRGYLTSTLGALPSYAVYVILYNYFKDFFESINPNQHTRGHSMWVTGAAGAVCEIASHVVFVPVDVVVQRMQLSNVKVSPFQIARDLVKREGYLSLYRGFGAACVSGAPASAVWWSTYEVFKQVISDNDPREWFGYRSKKLEQEGTKEKHHVQNYFAQCTAGFLAGAITTVVDNPLDVVKTRLQTQSRNPGDVYYKNIFDGVRTIIKAEGYKALWKGVGPRVAANTPIAGFSTLVYEFIMKASRKDDA